MNARISQTNVGDTIIKKLMMILHGLLLSQGGRHCGEVSAASLGSSKVMVAGRGGHAGHQGTYARCAYQDHHD